jgi:hypothetical protein
VDKIRIMVRLTIQVDDIREQLLIRSLAYSWDIPLIRELPF